MQSIVIRHETHAFIVSSLMHSAAEVLYILNIISSSEVAEYWTRNYFITAFFYYLPAQMLGVT